MQLMYPKVELCNTTTYYQKLWLCAMASGLCYNKDQSNGSADELEQLIRARIAAKHETIIEHASMSVLFTVDRGVSHELVRHRLCSFTQSSTRYCDYTGEREDGHVKFIIPPWCKNIRPIVCTEDDPTYAMDVSFDEETWWDAMWNAEQTYHKLRKMNWSPQYARSVLPNSLMTRIMVTANMREWRHIFALRAIGTTGTPHPQMREVMVPLFLHVKKRYPVFFQDMDVDETNDYTHVEVQ